MVDAGILHSGAGKVHVLRPNEPTEHWGPEKELGLTIWESLHHPVHVLHHGQTAAAGVTAEVKPPFDAWEGVVERTA